MAITDHVSVMRGGAMVAGRVTAQTAKEELAQLMVGRKVLLAVAKQAPRAGETVLVVEDITFVHRAGGARVDHLRFGVRGGGIVGLAGVSGAGQTETLELLSDIPPQTSGHYRPPRE